MFRINLSDVTYHPLLRALHGLFDGLYLSNSVFSYSFDAYDSTPNLTHDPLQSNVNTQHFYADHHDLPIIISEAIFITLLAFLGNIGKRHDKKKYSRVLKLVNEPDQAMKIPSDTIALLNQNENWVAYWECDGKIVSKSLEIEALQDIQLLIPEAGEESQDQDLIDKITAKYGCDSISTSQQISSGLFLFWPYFRQLLSGLKNGRHAVINTSFIIQQLAHASSFFHFANLIGVGVGIVLAANLIWYRRMDEQRRKHLNINNSLLEKIKKNKWCMEDLLQQNKIIYRQHKFIRAVSYASAALDGVTDGAYLYGCLFTLIGFGVCSFSPSVLIAAISIISIYMIISVITKLHEEYKRQEELEKSAVKCELELLENKVSKLFDQLENIDAQINEINDRAANQNPLENDAALKIELQLRRQDIETAFNEASSKLLGFQEKVDKNYILDKIADEWDIFLKEKKVAELNRTYNSIQNKIAQIEERTANQNPQENDAERLLELKTQKENTENTRTQAVAELKEAQEQFNKKYNNPMNKSSKVGNAIWQIARAMLSGAKNAKAAVDFVTYFVAKSLVTLVITICSAIIYGVYLGINTLADALSSKKSPEKPKAQVNAGRSCFGFFSQKKQQPLPQEQPILVPQQEHQLQYS